MTSITIENVQAGLDPTAAALWDVSLPLPHQARDAQEPYRAAITRPRKIRPDRYDHRALVTLDRVSKFYGDGLRQARVQALDDVSLSVRAGEIFGIIGRSGAGKSSLIRLINGLERPDTGTIRVGRIDIAALSAAELRQRRRDIGMIFQHFNLLASRNVFDNIALPLELAGVGKADIEARVTELLELVGLSDKQGSYPAALSGGQKQRVAIARALATKPSILLSDEATSALDPETTQSILGLLKRINAELGVTVILITHQMGVIKEICHRVAVIDAGRIVEAADTYDFFVAPESEAGRTLIGRTGIPSLPDYLRTALQVEPVADGAAILRLILAGEAAQAPTLGQLAQAGIVDLTILAGQVDQVAGRPLGSFLVRIPAALLAPDAEPGLPGLLESLGARMEVLGYVA